MSADKIPVSTGQAIDKNGWQNTGSHMQAVRKKMVKGEFTLTPMEFTILGHIVEYSFGYGKASTKGDYKTLSPYGSNKTVMKALHSLIEKNHISRVKNNYEMGPKKEYEYMPTYISGVNITLFNNKDTKVTKADAKEADDKYQVWSESKEGIEMLMAYRNSDDKDNKLAAKQLRKYYDKNIRISNEN